MSSNRIPLTRTPLLEQLRRQEVNLRFEIDADRGRRETSHSHMLINIQEPKQRPYIT